MMATNCFGESIPGNGVITGDSQVSRRILPDAAIRTDGEGTFSGNGTLTGNSPRRKETSYRARNYHGEVIPGNGE